MIRSRFYDIHRLAVSNPISGKTADEYTSRAKKRIDNFASLRDRSNLPPLLRHSLRIHSRAIIRAALSDLSFAISISDPNAGLIKDAITHRQKDGVLYDKMIKAENGITEGRSYLARVLYVLAHTERVIFIDTASHLLAAKKIFNRWVLSNDEVKGFLDEKEGCSPSYRQWEVILASSNIDSQILHWTSTKKPNDSSRFNHLISTYTKLSVITKNIDSLSESIRNNFVDFKEQKKEWLENVLGVLPNNLNTLACFLLENGRKDEAKIAAETALSVLMGKNKIKGDSWKEKIVICMTLNEAITQVKKM